MSTNAPTSRRENVRDIIHGVEVADPYRWIEDGASEETRAWIVSQQNYAAALLNTPARERFRTRLGELMRHGAIGTPIERKGYYFFARRRADEQRYSICRRFGMHGADEVLIDPSAMSADPILGVELLDVTRDGVVLAYAVRRGGEDEFEIRAFDVAARRDLPDVLSRALYDEVAWHPNASGFYYTVRIDAGPRLRFHRIGSQAADDREIFGSGLRTDRWVRAHVSCDGRYLIIQVFQGNTADRMSLHVIALADGALITVADNIEAEFFPSDGDDVLIILTNLHAPNRRVLRVELANPSRDAWREVVPEAPHRIESFEAVGGRLIVNYLENVHSRVRVFVPDGTPLQDIELPGIGTATRISGRWDSNEIFYSYTSYDHPPAIFRYDLASRKQDLWWQSPAPANLDQFELRQVWYQSKDGTLVPMYLFNRRSGARWRAAGAALRLWRLQPLVLAQLRPDGVHVG